MLHSTPPTPTAIHSKFTAAATGDGHLITIGSRVSGARSSDRPANANIVPMADRTPGPPPSGALLRARDRRQTPAKTTPAPSSQPASRLTPNIDHFRNAVASPRDTGAHVRSSAALSLSLALSGVWRPSNPNPTQCHRTPVRPRRTTIRGVRSSTGARRSVQPGS